MAITGARVRYFSPLLAFIVNFGIAISASGTDLVLQKVPPLTVEQAPNYPQNLARIDLGAQIETDPKTEASVSLLSGDPAATYPLKNGSSTLLISLAKIENIDRIDFVNTGVDGSVAIAIASAKLPANSPQWHDAGQQDLSGGLIAAKIGPAEAKYIRLTFNARTPGRIGNLGVYSTAAVSDFTMPRPRKIAASNTVGKMANYNLADLHAKARTLFVSSGSDLKLANNMIDGQPGTAYTFAGNDAAPAAIIDLGRTLPVNRISTFSTAGSGVVTLYMLSELPGDNTGNPVSTLHIDSQMLDGFKSVGSDTDDGSGRISVNFPETPSRYVMLIWTPSAQNANFAVAEVAVLGPASNANLFAANTGAGRGKNVSNSSDGKRVRDSKDVKDFSKEIPGEGPAEEQALAEGPPLPRPPPFVFIPRVTPTSF